MKKPQSHTATRCLVPHWDYSLKNYPHGNQCRGEEAYYASVPGAAESLARFDPPGSGSGTPSPGSASGWSALGRCLLPALAVPDRAGAMAGAVVRWTVPAGAGAGLTFSCWPGPCWCRAGAGNKWKYNA